MNRMVRTRRGGGFGQSRRIVAGVGLVANTWSDGRANVRLTACSRSAGAPFRGTSSERRALVALALNSLPDALHQHDQMVILILVYDAIVADGHTPEVVVTFQLDHPSASRLFG